MSLPLAISQAWANPQQGSVVAGDASFQSSGSTLTIKQQSQRAIINWQTFNIQSGETTRFIQPDSTSAVLNRVTSGNPTAIYGTLQANGRVYLVNPNGVVVGKNGTINTQSFVASTLDVSNAQFMAGEDLTFTGDSSSAVINLGHIEASGGDVYLIAHEVVNEGEIQADGEVGLVAGSEVVLRTGTDQRISIRVAADNAQVDNQGLVEAAQVQLKAANNNPYALAINQDGVVRANGAYEKEGRIILSADTGSTRVSGTLESSGGDVQVLGDEVTLASGAVLDVSANGDGGSVLVGGDYQGRGDVKAAQNTTVESDVRIDASAKIDGDGGKVIVWADEHAQVGGDIAARGGMLGGDGGFIETSGRKSIDFSVQVDASAPRGENGLWMIDPENLVIDSDSQVYAIEGALNRDTDVLITTFASWPLDENDTVTDQGSTEAFYTDNTPGTESQPGDITIDWDISKTYSDQEYAHTTYLAHRGDVPIGAGMSETVGTVDAVFLVRKEVNDLGEENEVQRDIVLRSIAQSMVDEDSDHYVLQELDTDFDWDLVWVNNREAVDGKKAPTLEILSPHGDININADIRSFNGELNVVLNAGSYGIISSRNQGVNINGDILTNGGDLTVRGASFIDVADNTLLSTRNVYGSSNTEIRQAHDWEFSQSSWELRNPSIGDTSDFDYLTISAEQLTSAWHNSTVSRGWSGDITLMTDKNIGYSSFYLFYRSDISSINIGQGANLVAHADFPYVSGNIRLLSIANLTDAFEDIGWLGVRNYAQSTINIGENAVLRGNAIDIIADAQADADVGSVISKVASEVAESTADTSPVASINVNEDDGVATIAELIMDTGAKGQDIESTIQGATPEQREEASLIGSETDVLLPMALIQKQAGPAGSKIAGEIPFVGEFLNFSPIAVAIAETDASVNIASGASIEGSDFVTIRAHSEALASGSSSAPGLALALAVSDSVSNVDIASNVNITSTAKNRYKSNYKLVDNQFFFGLSAEGAWGVGRGFLEDRSTTDAIEINSISSSSGFVGVEAASLTEEISSKILNDAAQKKAIAEEEGSYSDKTVNLDSPIDVALGLTMVTNKANLNVGTGADIEATQGSVDIATVAATTIKSSVTGGKVIDPNIDTGSTGDGSDGSVSDAPDANDIANIAVSIQYADVDVNSRIDGRVTGKEVNIGAASTVGKHINTATADNGYVDGFDGEEAIKEKIKDKNSQLSQMKDGVKQWLAEVGDKIKGKADEETKQKPEVESTDPKELEIGIAGAAAVTVTTFDVNNVIGATADITSNNPTDVDRPAINIWANHSSGVTHNSAIAGVHAGRKNATAFGLAAGIVENNVDTTIESGAEIRVNQGADSPLFDYETALAGAGGDASAVEADVRAISITADSTIESPFSVSKYKKKTHLGGVKKAASDPKGHSSTYSDPKQMGQKHITGLMENGHLLTTSWAQSYYIPDEAPSTPSEDGSTPTTEELNAGSDRSGTIGVAGSFGLMGITNNASVNVNDATIEVLDGSADEYARNDIFIQARSWAHTVMAAGSIAPPNFADGGGEEGAVDPSLLEQLSPGDRNANGVGGAFNVLLADSYATTNVYDGADIRSDEGDVVVDALGHYESTLVQVAGGKADEVGVGGAFGLANTNLQAVSRVADGANISANAVRVRSFNTMPGNLILSGGFAFSGAVGIGAGVAISNVNRVSEATLGYEGVDGQAPGGGTVTVDDAEVIAVSSGFVTTIGASGGVQAPDTEGFKADESDPNKSTVASNSSGSGDQAQDSTGGVGVSGSVAVNLVTAKTEATLDIDNGNISDTLNVEALNSTDITGVAGGASMTIEGGVAVTGAASINRIDNQTKATAKNLGTTNTFDGYDLNVTANSIGRIQGFSVGVAAISGAPDDGPNLAVAGSFTYNDIRTNTLASLMDSSIEIDARPLVLADPDFEDDEDAVFVSAVDGSQIIALAGALAIDATSGGDAAIGAGVGVNTLQGRVEAIIENTTIDAISPDAKGVAVAANRIAPIYAFGVAGGVGSSKMAGAASVGVNTIDTLADKGTFASITDSTIGANGVLDSVTVQSGNESQIFSLAGAISATTGSVALGGALSVSHIGGDVEAKIDSSQVETTSSTNVFASTASASSETDTIDVDQTLEDAKFLAAAAKDTYTNGAAGLVSLRDEENPPVVKPVDTIDLFGGESAIYTLAVAGGGSSNVAAFGSGTVNIIEQDVTANVIASTLDSAGDVNLLATNNASIRSGAGSLAISTGAAAVGGAASYNTLRGQTSATLIDSTVDISGDLVAGAERSGLIETLAAGAAVASNVGVQGSVAISTFADQILANISGSMVDADNANVIAREDVESTTASGGVAGGGTAAVGASVAVLVSENSTEASIGSSVNNNSDVDGLVSVGVRAQSKELHNTTAMTASVSGTVGVAGSVGVKVLNSSTLAAIDDNTRINQDPYVNGNVVVDADSQVAVTGAAGAVGVGAGAAGVGAGLDLVVMNAFTTAMIGDNAFVDGNNISVTADSARDVTSLSVAAGVGIYAGVGGAVSVIHVGGGTMDEEGRQALGQESYEDAEGNTQQDGNIQTHVNGLINSDYSDAQVTTVSTTPAEGDTQALIGASTVSATNALNVKASGKHDVDATAGALGLGAVGVGAGVTSLSYASHTAAITRNATLYAGNQLNVKANDQDASTHRALWMLEDDGIDPGTGTSFKDGDWFSASAFAGSGGLVGLGASVAVVNRDNQVSARIIGGSADSAGSILVDAWRNRHSRIFSVGNQIAGAAIGIAVADLTENGQVLASAGGNIGQQDDDTGVESLVIQADAEDRVENFAFSSSGGIVAGSGAVSAVRGDAINTRALLDDNAVVYTEYGNNIGNVSILASGTKRSDVKALMAAAAAGVAIGGVEARQSSQVKINSDVGTNVTLDATNLTQRAYYRAAEQRYGFGNKYFTLNNIYAEGLTAAGLVGGNSVVAISEQDQDMGVSVGDDSSLNVFGVIEQDTDIVGSSQVNGRGGAVSTVGSLGFVTAENNDSLDSSVRIGGNVSMTGQALETDQRLRNESYAQTRGLAGSIGSANVTQTSKLGNSSVSSSYSVGDGSVLEFNTIDIDVHALYLAYIDAIGTSGGSGAVNNVYATVDVGNLAATADFGDADILAGKQLDIDTGLAHGLNSNFRAEAYGATADAKVFIDSSVTSLSQIDMASGALLESADVNLMADRDHFVQLVGTSKVGAGAGASSVTASDTLDADAKILLQSGAEIAGANIDLAVKSAEDTSKNVLDVEVINDSASFFLKDSDITQSITSNESILLDGNLVGLSELGRSLDINMFGQYITVNGVFRPDLNIAESGVELADIAPMGAANITVDASDDGEITGSGEVINASHFFTDVNITGKAILNDLSLVGTPEALATNFISGNSYTPVTSTATAPTGGDINITGDWITFKGVIDAGTGTINVSQQPNLDLGSLPGSVMVNDGGLLRGQTVNLVTQTGSIGSDMAAMAIELLDGATTDASFSASAVDTVDLDVTLVGYDNSTRIEKALIGDISARGSINLALNDGKNSSGNPATAVYELATGSTIKSGLGGININAEGANTELVLNGSLSSGPAEGDPGIYVDILGYDVVDTNWDGLYTSFTQGGAGNGLILGGISNGEEGAGINIDASTISGSGSLYANGSGLDVSINNQWAGLDVLQLADVALTAAPAAITINGNSNVQTGDVDNLAIDVPATSGTNSIDILDPYSEQLVMRGDVITNGTITIDMANAYTVNTYDGLGTAPLLKADALDLRIMGEASAGAGSLIGFFNDPLIVDVGAGGLDVQSSGRVFIKDIAGDLLINSLSTPTLLSSGTQPGYVELTATDGSVIAAPNATITSGRFDITAAGDIDFGSTVVTATDVVHLDGQSISWAENDFVEIGSLSATGDVSLTDLNGLGIQLGLATVGGALDLTSNANIVAVGDFTGPVSIAGTVGANTGITQITSSGDLLLGDVSTGYGAQEDDPLVTSLRLTAAGNISQQTGTTASIQNRLFIDAGGDVSLDNAGNSFDGLEYILASANNFSLASDQSLQLNNFDIAGDLSLDSAGSITSYHPSNYVRVGGTSNLVARGGEIDLQSGNNDFDGQVTVDAATDVTLRNSGTLNLGSFTAGGAFTLYSGGDIIGHEQVDASFGRFWATNGSVILDNAANTIYEIGGLAAQDVTLFSAGELNVLPFDIAGTLTLNAQKVDFLEKSTTNGDFMAGSLAPLTNHVGALNVTANNIGTGDQAVAAGDLMFENVRTFTVDGDVDLNASGGVIHFDRAEFGGAVNADAAMVIINQQSGDLLLGDINTTDMALSAQGNILDQGTVIATGNSYLRTVGSDATSGDGYDIILDSAGNDFGTVDILGASSVAGDDVVLRDINDLALRVGKEFDASDEFSPDSLDVEVGGNFTVAAKPAEMPAWAFPGSGTADAVIRVQDDVRLVAGQNLNLASFPLYNGGSTWLETGIGDITLRNANPLAIQPNTQTHTYTLKAGGNIDIGFEHVREISGTQVSSADELIINSLTAGGDATVEGLTLTLGDVDVGGNLILNTDYYNFGNQPGFITVNGVATVDGTTTITTLGDVNLNNPLNDFVGDVSVFDVTTTLDDSVAENTYGATDGRRLVGVYGGLFWWRLPAADVSIVDRNNLGLGDSTIGGTLTAQASSIGLNGAVDVAESVDFNATVGSIGGTGSLTAPEASLRSAGLLNIVDGSYSVDTLTLEGAGITINTAGPLTVSSLVSSGDLDVSATKFTLSGDQQSTVAGSATFDISGTENNVIDDLQIAGDLAMNAGDAGMDSIYTLTSSSVGGVIDGDVQSLDVDLSGNVQIGTLNAADGIDLSTSGGISVASALSAGTGLILESRNSDLLFDGSDFAKLTYGTLNLSGQSVYVTSTDAAGLSLDSVTATGTNGVAALTGTSVHVDALSAQNMDITATTGDITGLYKTGHQAENQYQFNAAGNIDITTRTLNDSFGSSGVLTATGNDIRLDMETDGYGIHLGDIRAYGDLWLDNTSADSSYQKEIYAAGVMQVDGDLNIGQNGELDSLNLYNSAHQVAGLINANYESALEFRGAGDVVLGSIESSVDYNYLNIISDSGDITNFVDAGVTPELAFENADFTALQGDVNLTNVNQTSGSAYYNPELNISAQNVSVSSVGADGLSIYRIFTAGDLLLDTSGVATAGADIITANFEDAYRRDGIRVAGTTTLLTNADSAVQLDSVQNRFGGEINVDTGRLILNGGVADTSDYSVYIPDAPDSFPVVDAGTLAFGDFNINGGKVDLLVGNDGVVINGAINSAGINVWMIEETTSFIATNTGNQIVAATNNADLNIIKAGEPNAEGAYEDDVYWYSDYYYPAYEGDTLAQAVTEANVFDSTDLSVNALHASGDINLASDGDVSFDTIIDGSDVREASVQADGNLTVKAGGDIVTGVNTVSAGDLLFEAGNDIRLNGELSSDADIILAAGGNFHNDTGLVDPLSAVGRWLVYSTRPDMNTEDMSMSKDFFEYGVAYNAADPTPSYLPSGNGLVYSVLPVIEGLSLNILDQTIEYGNDINRTLSGSVSGTATGKLLVDGVEVDANVFGITVPTGTTVDTSNLVLDLNESVVTRSSSGFVNVGAYTDAIVVASADGSSPAVGISGSADLSVTAKTLTADSITAQDKVYDGTDLATLDFGSLTGAIAGDNVMISGDGTFASADAGLDQTVTLGAVGLTGADAGNYVLAPVSGTTTADILQRQLEITLQNQTRSYDGTTLSSLDAADYMISGFVAGESAELDKDGVYNSANVVDASTVTVALDAADFINQSGGINLDNYLFDSEVTTGGSILAANLVVDVNDASQVYNGVAYSGGNGATLTGLQGTDTLADLGTLTYGGTAQGATNAGTYVLSASGLSNENYSYSYRAANLEITPADLTITVNDASRDYNGQAFSGGEGVSYTGLVGGDVLNGTLAYGGTSQGAVDAGTYTLTASGLHSDNYAITWVDGEATITPKALDVTVADVTRTYDGTAFNGGTVSYDGFIAGEDASVLGGALAFGGDAQGATNAGSYSIAASGLSANNYDFNYVDGSLTIDQKALTVNLANVSKVYDGTTDVQLNTADFLLSGLVAGETAQISTTGQFDAAGVVDASSVSATLSDADFSGAGGFLISNYSYDGAVSNSSSSITQAALTISVDDLSRVYDGNAIGSADLVLSNSGFVAGESLTDLDGTLSLTGSAIGEKNVGTYWAQGEGLSSDNYNITWQQGAVEITPASLTVQVDDVSQIYSGTGFNGGSVTYTGFVGGDDASTLAGNLSFAGDAQGATNVGNYTITADGLAAQNYVLNYQAGSLAITPAALILTVNDASTVYDGTAYSGGNGVQASGFVEGESLFNLNGSLVYSGDSQGAVNAGGYTLSASGLTSSNYDINWVDGALTVDKRTLDVILQSQSKSYDGNTDAQIAGGDFILTGFVGAESVAVGDVSGTWNSKNVDDAYSVSVELTEADFTGGAGGFLASNYQFQSVVTNNTSDVTPVNLTLETNDQTKTYDAAAHQGGNGVTGVGLMGADTVADLDGELTYSGTSQGAVNVGAYSLVAGGLTSHNYNISWVEGTLNIAPAELTIRANNANVTYTGLPWSGGNGVTVTGLQGNDQLADLMGQLNFSGSSQGAVLPGQYRIRPAGLESDNYDLVFEDGLLNISTALTINDRGDNSSTLAMLDRFESYLPPGTYLPTRRSQPSFVAGIEQQQNGLIKLTGNANGSCRIDCDALSHVSSLDMDTEI